MTEELVKSMVDTIMGIILVWATLLFIYLTGAGLLNSGIMLTFALLLGLLMDLLNIWRKER